MSKRLLTDLEENVKIQRSFFLKPFCPDESLLLSAGSENKNNVHTITTPRHNKKKMELNNSQQG